MNNQSGCRGYMGSRPYFGDRAPQHVQNLVIRDYCQRNGLQYVLSATEYVMDGCYMMVEEVLREAPRLEGIVLCSLLMLPIDRNRQAQGYHRVFEAGVTPHGALESLPVRNENEVACIEDIWDLNLLTWQPGPSVPGVRVQEGRV